MVPLLALALASVSMMGALPTMDVTAPADDSVFGFYDTFEVSADVDTDPAAALENKPFAYCGIGVDDSNGPQWSWPTGVNGAGTISQTAYPTGAWTPGPGQAVGVGCIIDPVTGFHDGSPPDLTFVIQ
jgi:hypothetical protein